MEEVLKVSVIVPVYNPGANIDDCISSLLDQTLESGEYEVIFVDDGSSDGTEARLDALAAEHEHVRVEHIPNSGWPGRPRNVGIEMAGGEYVYFVDNDDWLGKHALERLHRRALRDDADIVIGKVVGEGKFVPRPLFKRDRKDVTLEWPPLVRLLTPHKLFRKAMLDEHGIRFPEGRRRLEDHVFTMHAYFHARRISVLARYPCYHWVRRDDGQNASRGVFDAAGYYGNVREVLDLVDAHMEPGRLRDQVRAHWYRGKMLGRVGGRGFRRYPPEFKRQLYEEIRALALERYSEDVHEWLAFNLRVRSALLRAGRYDALVALAEWEGGLRGEVTVRSAKTRRRGVRVRIEGRIGGEHGPPAFERRGERILWVPPAELAGELPAEALDATEEVEKSRLDLLVARASGRPEFVLDSTAEVRLEPIPGGSGHVTPVLRAEAWVDPRTAAAEGRLGRGEWRIAAVLYGAGFGAPRTEAIRRGGGEPEPLVLTVTPGGRLIAPGWRSAALRRFPGLVQALGRLRSRVAPAATAPPTPSSRSATRSAARPSSSSQKVDANSR